MTKRELGSAISNSFSPLSLQDHHPSLSAHGQAVESRGDIMGAMFPTYVLYDLQEKGWKGHAPALPPALLRSVMPVMGRDLGRDDAALHLIWVLQCRFIKALSAGRRLWPY